MNFTSINDFSEWLMSLISGSPPKETIATPWPSPPAWQPWAQVPSPGRQRHLSRLLYSSASFPSTLSPLYGDMPTLNRDFFRRGDPVAPPPGGGKHSSKRRRPLPQRPPPFCTWGPVPPVPLVAQLVPVPWLCLPTANPVWCVLLTPRSPGTVYVASVRAHRGVRENP